MLLKLTSYQSMLSDKDTVLHQCVCQLTTIEQSVKRVVFKVACHTNGIPLLLNMSIRIMVIIMHDVLLSSISCSNTKHLIQRLFILPEQILSYACTVLERLDHLKFSKADHTSSQFILTSPGYYQCF